MKLPVVALAVALLAGTAPLCATAADAPTIVMPSQLVWATSPMLPAGTKIAVISGNPTVPGPYIIRLMLPDGATFAPHFHGDTENVTVLEGTLLVGLGDRMDATTMTALPAGAFVSVPVGMHHYAKAKGVTILQLNGMGPMTMTAVNP
ncbi:MAG TPA: cupin domain-containing protein [Candidatus Tumulicola sp.]|jgi:quercetin dioxygenase-like cupin family protein